MQWAETRSEFIQAIRRDPFYLPEWPGARTTAPSIVTAQHTWSLELPLVPLLQASIHLMLTTPCPDPGPACHLAGKQRLPSGFLTGAPTYRDLMTFSVLALDMYLFQACTSTSVPLWTPDSAVPTWSPTSSCPPSSPLQCLSFLHSPASRGLSTLAAFLPHLQFPLQPTAS